MLSMDSLNLPPIWDLELKKITEYIGCASHASRKVFVRQLDFSKKFR